MNMLSEKTCLSLSQYSAIKYKYYYEQFKKILEIFIASQLYFQSRTPELLDIVGVESSDLDPFLSENVDSTEIDRANRLFNEKYIEKISNFGTIKLHLKLSPKIDSQQNYITWYVLNGEGVYESTSFNIKIENIQSNDLSVYFDNFFSSCKQDNEHVKISELELFKNTKPNGQLQKFLEHYIAFLRRYCSKKNHILSAFTDEIKGLLCTTHNIIFQGAPGTGKTEAVKQLARILNREIFMVDFSAIVDSKLGQTQKNLTEMFKEINSFINPEKVIVLFDEIDALALNRTSSNDLREMGRVTSTLLKCLDRMNENVVLVATTNLFNMFDKALSRRFDSIIDFNRYTEEDLMNIAEKMLNSYLDKMKLGGRDIRLFRKIMKLSKPMPYPGELKNLLKTAIAFSDVNDEMDYFRRIYYSVCGEKPENLKKLQEQGFTVREIEILTSKSKSSVSRELKAGVVK